MSAELDALQGEAAAVDELIAPQVVEPQQDAQPPQAANEAAEIVGLLTIASGLFAPVFPSLQKIYTQETMQQIAAAAVPVMNKHGWSTGDVLGKYAEELALAAVALPVALATLQGVKADIAARANERPQDTPQAITAPELTPQDA